MTHRQLGQIHLLFFLDGSYISICTSVLGWQEETEAAYKIYVIQFNPFPFICQSV